MTLGDVVRILSLKKSQVSRWLNSGTMPGYQGLGVGNHRMFSVPQAVSLYYADRWAFAGCGPSMLRSVLELFAGVPELSSTDRRYVIVTTAHDKFVARFSHEQSGSLGGPIGSCVSFIQHGMSDVLKTVTPRPMGGRKTGLQAIGDDDVPS